MKLEFQTLSLCSTCYKDVPAVVRIDGAVNITKTCSEHGAETDMLERDPIFYQWIKAYRSPSIYAGHFVDVTRRCQLRCDPCYYPLEKADPEGGFSIGRIVQECETNAHRAPFVLTGGEPTLHPEFGRLVASVKQVGKIEVLTNGVKFADEDFYDENLPLLVNANGVASLNLSIHTEAGKAYGEFIRKLRSDKIKLNSIMIVIRSEDEFRQAVSFAQLNRDVTLGFRLKAASNLWNEQKQPDRIFVSDMLNWLEKLGDVTLLTAGFNAKPAIVFTLFDGIVIALVNWQDVHNVDLLEIDCPPTYRARNGQVCNFVTAGLINEGMEKGWLAGRRINPPLKNMEAVA